MIINAALDNVPSIPRDDEGPVFSEPWQAQAFAMAVTLNEQGVFTWAEWVQTIAREIADDPDPQHYYDNWLTSLEKILRQKGVIDDHERAERIKAWDKASRATPHGEPIVLDV